MSYNGALGEVVVPDSDHLLHLVRWAQRLALLAMIYEVCRPSHQLLGLSVLSYLLRCLFVTVF